MREQFYLGLNFLPAMGSNGAVHCHFARATRVCVLRTVSVSPVTDASYQFGQPQREMNVALRRRAPTSDIDSVSFADSLSDSDADEQWLVIILSLSLSVSLPHHVKISDDCITHSHGSARVL